MRLSVVIYDGMTTLDLVVRLGSTGYALSSFQLCGSLAHGSRARTLERRTPRR